MLFDTNKQIGNSGLSLAIAYYGANGYIVSIPLNDTQDYDLIIDKNNVIQKVQVKATKFKSKYNIYCVSVKSSGGTKGSVYKLVKDTNIDILFAVCGNGDLYEIPKSDIIQSGSISLGKKYEKYKVLI